jgi:putative endonuclease
MSMPVRANSSQDGQTRLADKRRALGRGRAGEWLAALVLLLKGYRIVERNFRCKLGEIDIVARKGDLVVFVEVKARPGPAEAVDAVNARARRRIANAARIWIGRRKDAARLSWRFDIVAILPRRWPRHFKDAF